MNQVLESSKKNQVLGQAGFEHSPLIPTPPKRDTSEVPYRESKMGKSDVYQARDVYQTRENFKVLRPTPKTFLSNFFLSNFFQHIVKLSELRKVCGTADLLSEDFLYLVCQLILPQSGSRLYSIYCYVKELYYPASLKLLCPKIRLLSTVELKKSNKSIKQILVSC